MDTEMIDVKTFIQPISLSELLYRTVLGKGKQTRTGINDPAIFKFVKQILKRYHQLVLEVIVSIL